LFPTGGLSRCACSSIQREKLKAVIGIAHPPKELAAG
jgi:hypothetical protein